MASWFEDSAVTKAKEQNAVDIKNKEKQLSESKMKLAKTQTEITVLQLKANPNLVLTKEQTRQQVIEGIRQTMADGAVDLALVTANGFVPKIDAQGVKSLNEQVDAINKLKDDLDPDVDQATIAQIDSLVILLKGIGDPSYTGLLSTGLNAYDAYNKGSLNLFAPTSENIAKSATQPLAPAKK